MEAWLLRQQHTVGQLVPAVIRPSPSVVMIAITGHCNLRCMGCRYGRDFMVGKELSWERARDALDDAGAAGIRSVRFYGGEPLLHRDLAKMVAHSRHVGMTPYVTTNAVLLASKIDDLYQAGLRDITIGFYGLGCEYDQYTQRQDASRKMLRAIAAVRERYSDVKLQLNWLLRRQTCTPEALHEALDLAIRFRTTLQVDLVHYSLPYFTEGPERFLRFRAEDRPAIVALVEELLRLKARHPDTIRHTPEGIRSIPDWLLLGPAMRVPCAAREMLWVGPDGTVQLCYAAFKLGNLNEQRLRDLLFTSTHADAARRAFALNCPNCHCNAGDRIMRDAASLRWYTDPASTARVWLRENLHRRPSPASQALEPPPC
jgi:cyclic pyranopterin phosphate synthase